MKFLFPLILLLISTIGLFPLLHDGLFLTHDGDLQIARIAAYYKAIIDGQFPVRWGSDLNFGYGHPVLIFMYPLPSYLGAALYILGIGLSDSFKIITAASFVAANISMYLFLNEFFKNRLAAFIGALVYGFAPYRFLNMYVRGDIGEEMALVFVPLVLFALTKLYKKGNKMYVPLGGIFYALLILSHNGLALIFSPVLFLFFLISFFVLKDRRYLVYGISLFVIGLLLSAFFWIPALWESRFIQAKILIGSMFADHFPSIAQLLYSQWGFGPDVNKPGGLSPQIGSLQLVSLLAFIPLVFMWKNKRYIFALYFFIVFAAAIFFMTSASKSFWETIPFLPYLQFPWRINAAVLICASFISAYILNTDPIRRMISKNIGKLLLISFIALMIYISAPFTETKERRKINEDHYLNFTGDTTFHGQTNSIWTDSNKDRPSKSPIEIIGGEVSIENLERSSTRHVFNANVKRDAQILDNTVYFPGWQVKVDGQKVPIEFQDMNHRGLITFYIPKGNRIVEVEFKESPIRFISDILSLAAVILVTIGLVFYKKLSWVER
ncbi:MAG: hypothetical protein WD992_03230 [Candidatus Levyibacteriota bacterium]